MIVCGIDPGLSTGIAIMDGPRLLESITTTMGVEGFIGAAPVIPDSAVVVIEDYISDGTVNGRIWSSEVIGALYALHPGTIVRQLRSDKTGLIRGTEAMRNKWIDARFPGLPDQHQRDAICHALVYMKNQRIAQVLELWA